MITGLTTWCMSSPNFIQARLSGASQCERTSVTSAVIAASASSQGWKKETSAKTPVKVQPNDWSEGIWGFMARPP